MHHHTTSDMILTAMLSVALLLASIMLFLGWRQGGIAGTQGGRLQFFGLALALLGDMLHYGSHANAAVLFTLVGFTLVGVNGFWGIWQLRKVNKPAV